MKKGDLKDPDASIEGTQSLLRARQDPAKTRSPLLLVLPDGSDFTPSEKRQLIGSGPGVDLRLRDPFISKQHVAIATRGSMLFIEDLGSKNGTFIDDARVERAWASVGCTLRVGRVALSISANNPLRAADGPAVTGDDINNAASTMIGRSPVMMATLAALRRFAALRLPVLLRGETGTGKELAARFVHEHSPRRDKPLVTVNCGAIPASLAESLLFGHARGAFTGAERRHDGHFVEASGGTLFLDEVGELPLDLQAKLLRVLETQTVRPVGGVHEVQVDVRLIAATHRPLEKMIAEGHFREDLYHRLSVLVVELPPLRERREDIPLLLEHLTRTAEAQLGRNIVLSPAAITAAVNDPWPGNVRSLANAVLRAGALAEGPITPELLLPRNPEAVEMIEVPRGDFATMKRALLQRLVDEHGSIRNAARVTGVPRSTFGAWLNKRG